MSFRWPNGATAAVALTYDDALSSHCSDVAPALERHDLRATFYVMARDLQRGEIESWRRVAAAGHELGNHSLYHPCRKDADRDYDWLPDEYDLRSYTPLRWENELKVMNLLLWMIDGRTERTYGNTCCDVSIGTGVDETPMTSILEGLFVGARGSIDDTPADPASSALHQLAGFRGDGKTFERIRSEIEATAERGWLATYMIHGVGTGTHPLYIDGEEHEHLLGWLGSQRDRLWVAPLRDIALHIRAQQRGPHHLP